MVERAIGLLEDVVVRDDLLEPVILELALDHGDEGVAGESVQLDALMDEDVDLLGLRAILGELPAQVGLLLHLRRGGGLALKAGDIVKPEPEIDDLDRVRELIPPRVALEGRKNQETGDV